MTNKLSKKLTNKITNRCMSSFLALLMAFLLPLSAASVRAESGDKKVVLDIQGGVVEVNPTSESEVSADFNSSLCNVTVSESGNTTTVKVVSISNNWGNNKCRISLPAVFSQVEVVTAAGGVAVVSDVNADINVQDRGKTTVKLPANFDRNVEVNTSGVTNVKVPSNFDNFTFAMKNNGRGIVVLPFSDFHFLSKSYNKVEGNGEHVINLVAEGFAMLTVSFE